ncbi:MAG: hypothetical protein ACJLS3_05865 [Erythrobacter sp.]
MRYVIITILTGAGAMLAACSAEKSGTVTTPDGETAAYTINEASGETSMTIAGENGQTTFRSGANVPVSLPSGLTLFPGSRVVRNTLVDDPEGAGVLINFEADAAASRVVAHYRDAAKAAGYAIELEMTTKDTVMIGGERKSDGSTISVTATAAEPTSGMIFIGRKPGS